MWNKMKFTVIIVTVILLASLACAGLTADAPRVSLEAKDMPLVDAMAEISKQAGVQIVCDHDVNTTVTGQFTSMELEKLLNTLIGVNNLVWQKLYVPTPEPDKRPTVAEIKLRAAAVNSLAGGSIVVCDSTGKAKVFVEQDLSEPVIDPDKLGMTVVYLISKPKAADSGEVKKDDGPESQLLALENQRWQLLAGMSSEDRVVALQGQMKNMMDMDPNAWRQLMFDQMAAQRALMQDPQYRQVMQDAMRSLREQGGRPEGGPPGGWGDRAGNRDRGNRGGNRGAQ